MIDEPTNKWVKVTQKALDTIQKKYSKNRGMLLTEGDLECHLFSELMIQPEFSEYQPSKIINIFNEELREEFKTSYVHSQVTWFKFNKKSGFEADLTICDPKLLEVKNHEILLDYPSKGFSYDGPCVAIEVKFIRTENKASMTSHEDLHKFLNKLIPAKLENIIKDNYKISNANNVAFISIVGCKDKEIFIKSKYYLGKHLSLNKKRLPENLFVGLFYQDEVEWNINELISFYKTIEDDKKNN